MDLVTIDATKMIRRMRATRPMPNPLVTYVAAETDAVCGLDWAFRKADDLGDVAASVHVKAALPVTILALHSLLLMEGVLEILGGFLVTGSAGITPHTGSPGYFNVLGEPLLAFQMAG